jgi:hypothetical protein
MIRVKVQEVVKYGGHTLAANGKVTLTLNAAYSELSNTIQISQMLNEDVTIKARVPGKKAVMLGSFRVSKIEVFDDGESRVKFAGISDYVEMDNLNSLPLKGEDVPEFRVLIEAEIDDSENDEKDEDD